MEFLPHRDREDRPWGSFERFTLNEPSTVKILRVEPGKRLSLQRHHHREEFWRVIEGSGTATIGGDERTLRVGDEVHITPEVEHRLTGGSLGIAILEISFGDFAEDDIVRVEDDFGRSSPPGNERP